MKRKILAVMLSVVMAVTFMPAFAFAGAGASGQGSMPFHYVSLGDSSTAGYGMAKDVGYRTLVEGTYPALIMNWLVGKGYNVDLDQLADRGLSPKELEGGSAIQCGMRVEELRYLLDDNYSGDSYLNTYFENLKDSARKADYRDSIKDANLISYELGSVDFGAFMMYCLSNMDKLTDNAILQKVADDPDKVVQDLNNAKLDGVGAKKFSELFQQLKDAGLVDGLNYGDFVNAAAYAYYSFYINFDKSIEAIQALNKDACIVVLPINNMIGDITVSVASIGSANLGTLYAKQLIDKANKHMGNFVEAQAAAGYNEAMVSFTSTPQNFMGEAEAYSEDPSTITPQFKLYCKDLEDDLQLSSDKAFEMAALAMKDVASVKRVSIDADTITYLKNNTGSISTLGKDLMGQLKNEITSLEGRSSYKEDMKAFISSNLYKMPSAPNAAVPVGKLMMALGMRMSMGDGFFPQPSAKGHETMQKAVQEVLRSHLVHFAKTDATCTMEGSKTEYWKNLYGGKCYKDAAGTMEVKYSTLVINPLGHSYGQTTVIVPAGVGKDGKGTQECVRCHVVRNVTIPGYGPANTTITKVKAGKKSMTVKWKKPTGTNLANTTGYELRYSTSKSMSGAKTVAITKNTTTSKVIKKLKSKKKYFVQIRTYKQANGKKYYSAWSASKSVKVK